MACVEVHWHSPHLSANMIDLAIVRVRNNRSPRIIFSRFDIHHLGDLTATSAEAFVQATGAEITEGSDTPCYVPSRDLIRISDRKLFKGGDAFYAGLLMALAIRASGWQVMTSRSSYLRSRLIVISKPSAAFRLGDLFH